MVCVHRFSDLNLTLQAAERLSGTAYELGCSHAPLLVGDTVLNRALSVGFSPLEGVIISGSTAAWVWGALRSLALPLELSVSSSSRVSFTSGTPFRKREIAYLSGDAMSLGDRTVTTPLRTAFDILRSSESFSTEYHVACRLLLRDQADPRARIELLLSARSRIPNAALVRKRLQVMYP